MTAGRRHAALWMLGGGAAQTALALGANLCLVRLLAPEAFGRFALLLASLALFGSFLSLRIPSLWQRATLLDAELRSRLVNAARLESLLLGAIGVSLWLGGAFPAGNQLTAALLIAGQAAQPLIYLAQANSERSGRFVQLARLETAILTAGHGLAIAAAWAGLNEAALALRELWNLSLLGVGFALMGTWPRAPWRRLGRRDWRLLIHEAHDLWLDGLLESAYARTLTLAAGWTGGQRGAGLFTQALRLAQVPHQLLQPVAGRLAYNWFSKDGAADSLKTHRRLLLYLGPPMVLVFVGSLLLARPLVPWLLGERWTDAAPLVAALAGVAAGTPLLAVGKMRLLANRGRRALAWTRAAQWLLLGCFASLALAQSKLSWLAFGASVATLTAAGLTVLARSATRGSGASKPAASEAPNGPRESPARAA